MSSLTVGSSPVETAAVRGLLTVTVRVGLVLV
jgi:hypothetical protein